LQLFTLGCILWRIAIWAICLSSDWPTLSKPCQCQKLEKKKKNINNLKPVSGWIETPCNLFAYCKHYVVSFQIPLRQKTSIAEFH